MGYLGEITVNWETNNQTTDQLARAFSSGFGNRRLNLKEPVLRIDLLGYRSSGYLRYTVIHHSCKNKTKIRFDKKRSN
jgi:hypothetical protein